jgi:hypothetical protein
VGVAPRWRRSGYRSGPPSHPRGGAPDCHRASAEPASPSHPCGGGPRLWSDRGAPTRRLVSPHPRGGGPWTGSCGPSVETPAHPRGSAPSNMIRTTRPATAGSHPRGGVSRWARPPPLNSCPGPRPWGCPDELEQDTIRRTPGPPRWESPAPAAPEARAPVSHRPTAVGVALCGCEAGAPRRRGPPARGRPEWWLSARAAAFPTVVGVLRAARRPPPIMYSHPTTAGRRSPRRAGRISGLSHGPTVVGVVRGRDPTEISRAPPAPTCRGSAPAGFPRAQRPDRLSPTVVGVRRARRRPRRRLETHARWG